MEGGSQGGRRCREASSTREGDVAMDGLGARMVPKYQEDVIAMDGEVKEDRRVDAEGSASNRGRAC